MTRIEDGWEVDDYTWRVVGTEYTVYPTTLTRAFDDEGTITAQHVGHVVELLGAVPSPVDWSMVDTDHEVTITIAPCKPL